MVWSISLQVSLDTCVINFKVRLKVNLSSSYNGGLLSYYPQVDHLPICWCNAASGSLVKIGIAIGIEMVLGHEKLDVYCRGYSVKQGFKEYEYTGFNPHNRALVFLVLPR